MVASTSLVPHWAETLPGSVCWPQARLFFQLGYSLLDWNLESLEWYLLLGRSKRKNPRNPPKRAGLLTLSKMTVGAQLKLDYRISGV